MSIFELIMLVIGLLAITIFISVVIVRSVDSYSLWALGGPAIAIVLAIATLVFSLGYNGFFPNYEQSYAEGYLIYFGKQGYIWRTYEGEIQLGTGNQTAVQNHLMFSTPDAALADQITKGFGKHVKIHILTWKIVPWPMGDSEEIVDSIEVIP